MGPLADTSSKKTIYALLAAWVLLGLAGHDPWKPDEAYSFGLVYSILERGEWVIPLLAGQPFMEKPPLFYASAAVFAKLFGGLLPLHDAARLASGFYVALALVFTAKAARSVAAPLFLIACLGYAHHAHLLITDNALVAGMAIALYGLTVTNGWLLGTGAGIAFMSKGLLGPGVLGMTALVLLAWPAWRSPRYWGTALIAFAPWALIWPALLYWKSPPLFHEWLWVQNLGRFTGEAAIGGVTDHLHYLKALPWFAFPAWPLAAWTVWQERRNLAARPGLVVSLVAFAVMLLVLSASSAARQIYALPMLVPIAILAAAAVQSAPRWLGSTMSVLAVAAGAIGALALWGMWVAFLVGRFPQAAYPGFVPSVHGVLLFLAVLVTLAGFFLLRKPDLALRWAAAATLAWGLAMTLWLPWLDYSKTYRDMIASMPRVNGCVASRDLGEPQRAMFHYFAGMVTVPQAKSDCRVLLVQTGGREVAKAEGWKLLWQGSRPGDDIERFWLFSR